MSSVTKIKTYFAKLFDKELKSSDKELYDSIKLEHERQSKHIELIASENIVSKAVLQAQGSVLTLSLIHI